MGVDKGVRVDGRVEGAWRRGSRRGLEEGGRLGGGDEGNGGGWGEGRGIRRPPVAPHLDGAISYLVTWSQDVGLHYCWNKCNAMPGCFLLCYDNLAIMVHFITPSVPAPPRP